MEVTGGHNTWDIDCKWYLHHMGVTGDEALQVIYTRHFQRSEHARHLAHGMQLGHYFLFSVMECGAYSYLWRVWSSLSISHWFFELLRF